MRTFELTLEGIKHEVPIYTLGQLRKIAKLPRNEDLPWTLLEMAMEKATPPMAPEEIAELQLLPGEFAELMQDLLVSAGIEQRVPAPGEAPAPLTPGQ